MTAILAINNFYQIFVIADCRVSWQDALHKPQDNLQKIYPFGPTGVIAFSGDIRAAKAILAYIHEKAATFVLPPSARSLVPEISDWAQQAFLKLPFEAKQSVKIMFAASDYGRVHLVTDNVIIADNILVKMASPKFEPVYESIAVRLGYATKYPLEYIQMNMDNMLNDGLNEETAKFGNSISILEFSNTLASYSPSQVGGLFIAATISAQGVRWITYRFESIELKIENGHFVQYDHSDGRKTQLKHIWEFDPLRPDAGKLLFQMPELR